MAGRRHADAPAALACAGASDAGGAVPKAQPCLGVATAARIKALEASIDMLQERQEMEFKATRLALAGLRREIDNLKAESVATHSPRSTTLSSTLALSSPGSSQGSEQVFGSQSAGTEGGHPSSSEVVLEEFPLLHAIPDGLQPVGQEEALVVADDDLEALMASTLALERAAEELRAVVAQKELGNEVRFGDAAAGQNGGIEVGSGEVSSSRESRAAPDRRDPRSWAASQLAAVVSDALARSDAKAEDTGSNAQERRFHIEVAKEHFSSQLRCIDRSIRNKFQVERKKQKTENEQRPAEGSRAQARQNRRKEGAAERYHPERRAGGANPNMKAGERCQRTPP